MWKGKSARLSFAVIGISVLAATSAGADESLEMISYSNAPGGAEIVAGDYDAAIAAAASRLWRLNTESALIASTNLCVAYTVKGELAAAERACDEALSRARSIDRASRASGRRVTPGEATARALSNRGVLRARVGDALLAAADFREAAHMSGVWAVPTRNLELVESSMTLPAAVVAAE
jgi:hypothetical protein